MHVGAEPGYLSSQDSVQYPGPTCLAISLHISRVFLHLRLAAVTIKPLLLGSFFGSPRGLSMGKGVGVTREPMEGWDG